MDGPVTLMMQKTLLVKKEKAGNQDAKKKRMLKVVRGRGEVVGVGGLAVGWFFGIGVLMGLKRERWRGREGGERWRVAVRGWRMGRRGRRRIGMWCEECS